MNFELFVAKRISYRSHRSFSRAIIRIALIAVALSLATMLITVAIVLGFQNEIKQKVIGFASDIQIGKTRTSFTYENEPIQYSADLARRIQAQPEVSHIQTFATKPGLLKTETASEGIVLKGVDKNFDWKRFSPRMVAGKPPVMPDSEVSRQVVISKYLSKRMNLKVGDEVRVYFIDTERGRNHRQRLYTISGIYQTSIEEFDKLFILGDLRDVQRLNLWTPEQVGGYEIFLKQEDMLEAANHKIRFLPGIAEDVDTRTVKERYPQIYDWLDLLNMHIKIVLSLMGVVAAINMVTTLLIMILERTQMIGLLKALGATSWQVRRIFMWNAISLIGLGLLIGNIIGVGLMALQNWTHFLKLNEEEYYLSEVPVLFSWTNIILVNLGAFTFCTLAMLLPSLLVTRIRPVKALRFE